MSSYYQQSYCVDCLPGEYSTLQDLESCNVCPAGFICYGGTSRPNPTSVIHHKGEVCPKGHYCPAGSTYARACDPGTYNDELGATAASQCKMCPENTFNDKYGQTGCRPCGFYARSTPGASTCSCIGEFRAFSEVDSSCTCKSLFDFKNTDGVSQGSESSLEDCIPLVFDRCDGVGLVRAPDGTCKGIFDCSEQCGEEGGVRSEALGICTCNSTLPLDSVCPTSCRKNSGRSGTTEGSTSLSIVQGDGTPADVDLASLGDVLGTVSC